jgi:uncharacterized protein (DUF885 family)
MSFQRIISFGLCLGALTSTALAQTGAPMNQPGDETLAAFFKQLLEDEFALSPMRATRLGDHRFDALLDDVSATAFERRRELTRRTLEQLPLKVDYTALSRAAQIDYEILRDDLNRELWLQDAERPWEIDPRLYTGLATECAYALLTQSTQPREANIRNAIARIKLVPAMLVSARSNLLHPSRVRTETAIQQNRGAIAFYDVELLKLIGDSPQRSEAISVARDAAAALQQHQSFLETELLPRSTSDWRIGRDRFARKLDLLLDAGVTADEVLAEAEAAFSQVQHEMLFAARQLWPQYFPKQPLPPDDDDGRSQTIRAVVEQIGRDHGTAETLARDAQETVATLKQFIAARDILCLPEPDACQIIEMPEFQRGNSVAFLESAPPLDASAASIYAISPPPQSWSPGRVESFLSEYNRQMLRVLTIHEAYPGHYVQLAYANRQPSLLRRVLGSGVYAEGWANYCEQMLLDQGYGDGDLALRLMQLKFFLRSVANAILDHKMHCTEMTDDEAVSFLTDQAYQSEGEARLKVIRAKLGSCQLSTYFVGRGAFMRLRRTVQREEGDQFDLGRFHEAVLDSGTVPVKYLPELTRTRLRLPR